jgi:hypothetical protein
MIKEKITPEDVLLTTPAIELAVSKRQQVASETGLEAPTITYAGRERRAYLDEQVEALYGRIIKELNYYPTEAALALRKLRQAQDKVLESPEAYNEALGHLADVKMMLIQKETIRRWSYTWGLLAFFYAVIWLAGLGLGFFVDVEALLQGQLTFNQDYSIIWYCSLAGGLGGVVAVLHSLGWRVAKYEFDRQDVLTYFVWPVSGLILGIFIFFVAQAGFLAFGNQTLGEPSVFVNRSQLFLILLGWIAGFRQQDIFDLVDSLLARVLPKRGNRDAKLGV